MKKPTKTDIANELGVSRKTLYEWEKKGAPIHRGLLAVSEWRAARAPAQDTSGDDEETAALKHRLMKAQAEHYEVKTRLLEIENQLKTGQLIDLATVEKFIERTLSPVMTAVKSMPDRLAHLCNPGDPQHAREILNQEMIALHRLAQRALEE